VTSGQVFSGDTLSGLSQVFGSKNVLGANQSTLSVNSGYTLSDGNSGNNYAVGLADVTGTINQLALSGAAIAPGSSIYGTALTPGAVSFGNIVGSDAVGSSASVNASTLSTSGNPIVGTYSQSASGLTGADAGNYSFSGFTTAAENYSISKAPIIPTFTINNKPFDGNSIATVAAYSLQGVLAGDAVSIAGASATFDNAFAGNNKPVTIDGFALSGPEVNNYRLSSGIATATASITPRAIVPANEEPIKNNQANPGVGQQSGEISSSSNPQSIEIDSSDISPSASVAAESNDTPSGPDPSQATPSVSDVAADSAAQEFQESDQRSAEAVNASLGLSEGSAGVAISPARLQLLMQNAAMLIRNYPIRLPNP
jgi:hypothetical protein